MKVTSTRLKVKRPKKLLEINKLGKIRNPDIKNIIRRKDFQNYNYKRKDNKEEVQE